MTLVVGAVLPEAALSLLRSMVPGADIRSISWDLDRDVTEDMDAIVVPPSYEIGTRDTPRPGGWPFNLRWVQLLSAGLDGYPAWVFDGPVVTSARGVNAVPVAEFAMAAMLAHAKRLPEIWLRDAGSWRYQTLSSLAGKSLGLVGFGAVGSALAARARAFDMEVNVLRASDAAVPSGHNRVATLADLMAASDHLVLAAPSTPQTRDIINDGALACAKPGLHLINIGRGDLVDEPALIRALDAGRLSGATLDVLRDEPPAEGNPLINHPLVRVSSHVAGSSQRTMQALATMIGDNADLFQRGQPLRNLVSEPSGGNR